MTAYPPAPDQSAAYPPPPPPAPFANPAGYPPPPPANYPSSPGAYPPAPPAANTPGTYPPPPPMSQPAVKAPFVAWFVPLAALVAIIGAATPWFNPTAKQNGVNVLQDGGALYSWKDGRIGLAAPILLVLLSISVIGLLRGKVGRRFKGTNPVRSLGTSTIIIGLIAVATAVIAWFLVPGQYHFTAGATTLSWHDLQDRGLAMSRGPQIGFFLTIVAGVLAVIAGIAVRVQGTRRPAGPSLTK